MMCYYSVVECARLVSKYLVDFKGGPVSHQTGVSLLFVTLIVHFTLNSELESSQSATQSHLFITYAVLSDFGLYSK